MLDHSIAEDMQVLLGSSLQPRAVCEHALATLRRFPCRPQALTSLQKFLEHPLTQKVLACDAHRLESLLSNDAYKPKMHSTYSRFLPGVSPVEFALHVRRTPIPLRDIRDQDPLLWAAFQEACTRRLHIDPYPPAVRAALEERFSGFKLPPAVLERQKSDTGEGIYAELSWEEVDWGVGNSSTKSSSSACDDTSTFERHSSIQEKELVAFATGSTAESASHVETTLTQLVQEVTIAAQVRALDQDRVRTGRRRRQRKKRASVTEEELLGNALARLAMGVDYLNYHYSYHSSPKEEKQEENEPKIKGIKKAIEDGKENLKMILFAGRRSSSRRYLLLQNLYCCWNLYGFAGTSSILAATLLPQLEKESREEKEEKERKSSLNKLKLVGTLAHEVPMALAQLISSFPPGLFSPLPPQEPSSSASSSSIELERSYSILQIAALLAHLLMLRSNGGLLTAIALPDTFGTRGFLATALAAKVPREFLEDMEREYPEEFSIWKEKQLKKRYFSNDEGDEKFENTFDKLSSSLTVFDLFSIWRMDSGNYETMATAVLDAWKHRHNTPNHVVEEFSDQPVLFMHSNLGSYEEAAAVMKLPNHIRPSFLCFGTLADGFLPFEWEGKEAKEEGLGEGEESFDGEELEELKEVVESAEELRRELGLVPQQQSEKHSHKQPVLIPIPPPVSEQVQLASVVMKVVQAKHSALSGTDLETKMPCAAKLGDDYDSLLSSASSSSGASISATEQNKLQLDPRLSDEEKIRVIKQLKEAAGAAAVSSAAGVKEKDDEVHSKEVSAALAAAYRAITREGLLS